MSRRGAALLLLALGACAVASAEVAYILSIDDSFSGPFYVGYPVELTGSLLSDENCEPPPPPPTSKVTNKFVTVKPFCKPVANTSVTIKLEEGVGELSASPAARLSAVNPKSTATPSGPGSSVAKKPATKAVAALQVTTNDNGQFSFSLSSAVEGDSVYSASAQLGNTTVSTEYNTTVSWSNPQYTVWADQETAYDTVGYPHTLKFTLLLGPIPVRQASPPSNASRVPSQAPKALEDTPFGLPVVPNALIKFYRIDTNASDPQRAAPKKANGTRTPTTKDTLKARVRSDYVEFASGTTDADGNVYVEVPSPDFAGSTDVFATYVDAAGQETTGWTTIYWVAPVTPNLDISNTNNVTSNITLGEPTTVTVSIVDAAGEAIFDVPVTFNVAGSAVLVTKPERKAPRVSEVVDEVVNTDFYGQASIQLTSDNASVNTLSISYDINGRIFHIDPFTIIWGAPSAEFTTINLAPKRLDVRVGRPANLTATVSTDAGVGVENVRVRFTLTPSRAVDNAEAAQLQADESVAGAAASAEVATHYREAVTDANGEAVLTLTPLMPGRVKVVASAGMADTPVTSEPSYVTWYSKGHKGNYGKKPRYNDYNKDNKDAKKYREGEYRKHEEDKKDDKKGSYKRPHSDY